MKTRSAVQKGKINIKRNWKTTTDFKPQRYSNQHKSQWKDGTKMHITCSICGLEGHYSIECNQRNPSLSAAPQYTTCDSCGLHGHSSSQCNQGDPSLSAAPKYAICYSCGLHGHYSSQCNQRDPSVIAAPGNLNENQAEVFISDVQSLEPFNYNRQSILRQYLQDKINGTITCMVCGMEGHYTSECPGKDRKDKVICTICSKDGHDHLSCCQQSKSENRACTRCGELGHIDSNHRLDCSSCDEHHPLGNCQMSEVTCFVCEGGDHCPAQCPLNSVLTTVFQNQRECFRDALRLALSGESSKVTTPAELSKESEVCEPDRKSSGKKASAVKCFSCGKEGHRAKGCHSKPHVPTPSKSNPLVTTDKTPTRASKKLCFNCGEEGHPARNCTLRPALSEEGSTVTTPANLSKEQKPSTSKQLSIKPASSDVCRICGEEGHWARSCPSKRSSMKTA